MALLGPLVLLGLWIMTCIPVMEAQTMDQIISLAQSSSEGMDLNEDEFTVKVEMDMLFERDTWDEIQRLNNAETNGRRHKRKAARDERTRWSNGVVPYTIANHFSSTDLQQINAGIADWERYTCLNFRQATSNDANRLYIYSGGGCSSYVGMIGGQQSVSLGPGCRQKGVVIHELGHAIGFHHEQTRPDRHNYVDILTHNIQTGTEFNFQQYSTTVQRDYNVPYDYTSVMHYGQYAFSANGQPTIRTHDTSKQHVIGNRQGHSFRDVKLANLMYNCGGHCGSKTCPGEGFVGKDCECYCPGNPVTVCSGDGGGGGGEECMDSNANCAYWAANGECTKNPSYMHDHCKQSCDCCDGGCKAVCEDGNEYCNYWASVGYCNSNLYRAYMHENCKASCQLCGGGSSDVACTNESPNCQYWADNGECQKNPNYMHESCSKACNLC